ncbi:MAG: ATP-binding protein [Pseudomonadota bacterium]|nr:ATP-binding protein [Pseudomonadota bacterium]
MKAMRSIRLKLVFVLTLTALCALLVSGGSIFLYEISSFRNQRIDDLSTQVDLLAYSATPALQFLDQNMAAENLELLRIQSTIAVAAIYDANGMLFASHVRSPESAVPPERPPQEGIYFRDASLEISKRIVLNNAVIGTAFLRSDYPLRERIQSFIGIQSAIAIGALMVAVVVSVWLQSFITNPVLSIADIAREVVTRKDFRKRATKISDDEVGTLVDAFNDMLNEIEARTTVLETTNAELTHEISERKRARSEILYLNGQLERRIEELHEKDRNKDDFLATLAHELRNPLAPIRTGLEIVRKADDGKREQIYAIMERQTNHLVRLVDDLMEVSRISRGKITLRKQGVVLDEVMQSAVDATSELLTKKRHELVVQLPENKVQLHADPVRLTQVFLNLLSNAANYTEEGGRIEVTAECHDDILEVVVQDNGVGMEPEMLEKVFDPFIQLENPLSRARGGLGIGLTLARSLVRMHGGSLRAESEGPGKGSRFIVMLPVQDCDTDTTDDTAGTDALGKEQRRILVVDDNEDAALTLAMQLRIAGHDLKMATSGAAAIGIAGEFRPHVVLMDIGMPGMNGLDAARAMRREEWGAEILLVAVTGWGQSEDKRQTFEAGFDHHLVKPIRTSDIERLLAATRNADPGAAVDPA